MTGFSDQLYQGAAPQRGTQPSTGITVPNLVVQEFGAIPAAVASGVFSGFATVAGVNTLTPNGSLVTAGIATFAVARTVSFGATGNLSTATITVVGLDQYNQAMTQKRVGPNAGTVETLKAFKSVTSITVGKAVTGRLKVGSGTSYGLQNRIYNTGRVLAVSVDGVPETTLTVTPGLLATLVSTATTGDIRGTVKPNTAANGTKNFTASYITNPASTALLYGPTQA